MPTEIRLVRNGKIVLKIPVDEPVAQPEEVKEFVERIAPLASTRRMLMLLEMAREGGAGFSDLMRIEGKEMNPKLVSDCLEPLERGEYIRPRERRGAYELSSEGEDIAKAMVAMVKLMHAMIEEDLNGEEYE